MNPAKLSAPVREIARCVAERRHVGGAVDPAALDFLGVFLLKAALPVAAVAAYADAYFQDLDGDGLTRTPFHRTEVKVDVQHRLNGIIREPAFVAAVSSFFGGNVGVDFIRIVKKDGIDTLPVFLHQDTCYQVGGFERYSVFIPLTHCHPGNGSLTFYPGTKHFGYLGDAGEIASLLPPDYPTIESDADVGDLLIMHSATWHASPENRLRSDRVYLEVHIQHANEPTTRHLVCGERTSPWRLDCTADELFLSSRAQRIKQLYQELKEARPATA